mmetsp:Transcript_22540/g.49823  ORF Transcript_22540/g.49823 Transcript_22540/m.49823 type:complete len:275 (+) Transcript_22540:123-947(+)
MALLGLEQPHFTIKNTFIDLGEGSAAPTRRASSAPPLREACDAKSLLGLRVPSSLSICEPVAAPQRNHSDESTEAGASDEEASLASGSGFLEGPFSQTALVPAPVQGPEQRMKLRSLARPWKPTVYPKGDLGLPYEVAQEFNSVIVRATAALEECGFAQSIHIMQSSCCCYLSVQLLPELFHNAEQVLATARSAITKASEASRRCYLIGYETMPFTPKPWGFGFSSELVLVTNEANACWDLLAKGHCQWGRACRWRHPSWQVSFEVAAMLAEFS